MYILTNNKKIDDRNSRLLQPKKIYKDISVIFIVVYWFAGIDCNRLYLQVWMVANFVAESIYKDTMNEKELLSMFYTYKLIIRIFTKEIDKKLFSTQRNYLISVASIFFLLNQYDKSFITSHFHFYCIYMKNIQ